METRPTPTATATVPWHHKPGPTLVAGIALLALCGVFLVAWVTTGFFAGRWLGYLSGAAGTMLVYGGATGLREGR